MREMGRLTTHVLDISRGAPAAGMRIDLYRGRGPGTALLKTLATNPDGRTDAPLLDEREMAVGDYTIVFHVGGYYREQGHPDAGRFLDEVPVAFTIDERDGRYHVPLLVSPWSYSTYRGS